MRREPTPLLAFYFERLALILGSYVPLGHSFCDDRHDGDHQRMDYLLHGEPSGNPGEFFLVCSKLLKCPAFLSYYHLILP